VTKTWLTLSCCDRIVSSCGRSDTDCIASIPFITRLMMTCCNWTRSAQTINGRRRKLHPQRHPAIGQLPLHQGSDLVYNFIDVEPCLLAAFLGRQRPDAPDHIGGATAVVDDPFHRAARRVHVGGYRC